MQQRMLGPKPAREPEHLLSDNIRERLSLEPDLTLEKNYDNSNTDGSCCWPSKKNKKTFDVGASVQAVQSKPHKRRNKQHFHPVKSPTVATPSQFRSCFRCGSDKHLANPSQCPAAKAQCKSCNKRGYFVHVFSSIQWCAWGTVTWCDSTVLRELCPCPKETALQCQYLYSHCLYKRDAACCGHGLCCVHTATPCLPSVYQYHFTVCTFYQACDLHTGLHSCSGVPSL